jgi:hypothetical protein
MVLAVGLELLGVLARMNLWITPLVSRDGAETFPKTLPGWWSWSAATVFAFGVSFTILGTPGQLRRGLLWASALLLVAAWAPVLSLSARSPDIAAPCIATFWSGICALVYASRHNMPVDQSQGGSSVGESSGA